MSELLDYEILAEQLNTKFTLLDSAQLSELELVEVTAPTVTANQTCFSLFFFGGGENILSQGTYRTMHERLGETLFFLVPTARVEGGFTYEAVFNLLNEPAREN